MKPEIESGKKYHFEQSKLKSETTKENLCTGTINKVNINEVKLPQLSNGKHSFYFGDIKGTKGINIPFPDMKVSSLAVYRQGVVEKVIHANYQRYSGGGSFSKVFLTGSHWNHEAGPTGSNGPTGRNSLVPPISTSKFKKPPRTMREGSRKVTKGGDILKRKALHLPQSDNLEQIKSIYLGWPKGNNQSVKLSNMEKLYETEDLSTQDKRYPISTYPTITPKLSNTKSMGRNNINAELREGSLHSLNSQHSQHSQHSHSQILDGECEGESTETDTNNIRKSFVNKLSRGPKEYLDRNNRNSNNNTHIRKSTNTEIDLNPSIVSSSTITATYAISNNNNTMITGNIDSILWKGDSELVYFTEYSKNISENEISGPVGVYYKFHNSEIKLIKNTFEQNGLRECGSENLGKGANSNSYVWNIMWSTSSLKSTMYQNLLPTQKINHFPRSQELTRKDSLYKNLSRMQSLFGEKHYNFFPKTYVLPGEYEYLSDEADRGDQWWIIKPSSSSQGKGIFITNRLADIPQKQNVTVSHYISKPLLINSYKFDLRIYVAITSLNPLRLYIFEEGLVRLSTTKYVPLNENNRYNRYMHLTNYSVNKTSVNFVKNTDAENLVNSGSKQSFKAFKKYCEDNKINYDKIFENIEDIVVKTMISAESYMNNGFQMFVSHKNACFELLGFDVLIDENLKPYLLEVNLSPSLNCDSPLDLKIKAECIANLFNLAGIVGIKQPQINNSKKRGTGVLISQIGTTASRLLTTGGSNSAQGIQNLRHQSQAIHRSQYQTLFLSAKDQDHLSNKYSKSEKKIIQETINEYSRRGNFKRIFPSKKWGYYKQFFEEERPLNGLLANYLFSNKRCNLNRLKNRKANSPRLRYIKPNITKRKID